MNRADLFLLACLALLLGPASALEPGEVQALVSIRAAFPSLSQVHPMDQYRYLDGVDENWGGSWGVLDTLICDDDGWRLQGIYCSDGGKVAGIRFSEAWGNHSGSILDVSGLLNLNFFTSSADFDANTSPHVLSMSVLLEAVLSRPSLIRLETDWPLQPSEFPSEAFAASNLQVIKLRFDINAPKPSIDNLNLVSVSLNWFPPLTNFTNSFDSLLDLEITSPVSDSIDLTAFTILQTLIYVPNYPSTVDELAIPDSLRLLHLHDWLGSNLTIGGVNSLLQTLILEDLTNPVSIDFLPSFNHHLLETHPIFWHQFLAFYYRLHPREGAHARHFQCAIASAVEQLQQFAQFPPRRSL
jgi:hypothetical protein